MLTMRVRVCGNSKAVVVRSRLVIVGMNESASFSHEIRYRLDSLAKNTVRLCGFFAILRQQEKTASDTINVSTARSV